VRDGRVFVGSLSGKILAADLASGARVWEAKTGGEVRCAPAVAGGLVYCGSDDGIFRALDAATGAEKWTYACGGPVQAAPAVVGGAVIFGANDCHLYALDRKTGKKLWSFRTQYPMMQAPPVIHGGQVFAAQWVDWAYALDAASGKEQWRTCVPISIEALQFHRDKLWLRSAYQFAEFDPANGKRLRIGDAAYGYNGLAFLKSLLITTGTGSTAAVDLDSAGTDEKGKTPNLEGVKVLGGKGLLGSPRLGSAGTPLALGEALGFATRDGEVAVTDPAGKVLWSTKLGGTCHATPVAAAGVLVVGCDDGKLYAFRQKAR
jgi:outer membrane protein assembly factor BamB